MCSIVIVHSGQQHQRPMWDEEVYSDSYLTSRLACFTGRTTSFNFRTLVATEKCAVLCTQREVNKGKTWERERKTNGEWDDKADGERETDRNLCGKMNFTTYHSIPGNSGGGGGFCSGLLWLPHSSIFKSVLCLTSHQRQLLLKALVFSQGRGSEKRYQDVQFLHCSDTTTFLLLWTFLWMCQLVLWQFQWPALAWRKTQDLPAEWGNTHREGRNSRLAGESDIIQV